MPTLLLALLLAQAPQSAPTPERHAGWLHTAIAAHAIAQFADVSTTAWAMGRGGFRESNPIMRPFAGDPVKLAVFKGTYAVGTTYLFKKMHRKRPKTAFALAAGSAVVTSWVAHKNAQLVRKH